MKSKISIFIIVCFFSALLVFAAFKSLSCSNGIVSEYIPPNEGIISFKDFYVTSNSTGLNTSARGTIFLEIDKSNNYKAQIIAWIEIDPRDWGGVCFTIPMGWEATNLIGSYPDLGNTSWMSAPVDQVTSAEEQGSRWWDQWIAIGNQIYSPWITSNGGTGSVILELTEFQKGQKQSDVLKIMVGVGSEEKDGVQIMNPDFETIEIPVH